MFVHPDAFGVVTASPLQRAICRAMDGLPLGTLWDRPEVRRAFGGSPPPDVAPHTMAILAAIRCGKSMIAAAKAIQLSQSVSFDGLSAGDELLIPVLATSKKTARQTYFHILGNLQAKPFLRRLLAGEPTAESVWVHVLGDDGQPTGRVVEISVAALSKHSSNLVGRWLPGVIFDEAPRMAGDADSTRNLDDALDAIAGRIRPGGQVMLIGSPLVPFGPAYDIVQKRFGRPGPDCVVVRAPGPDLNPGEWTPRKCAELERRNPDAYRTDVLAEFGDPDSSILSANSVDRAMRRGPETRKPEPGLHYVAAMDPGARASAWTLVILGRQKAGEHNLLRPHYFVAHAEQWRAFKRSPSDGNSNRAGHGVASLDPRAVLHQVKALCDEYGVDEVHSDHYAAGELAALADVVGVQVTAHQLTAEMKWQMAEAAGVALDEGTLELPPSRDMREDLVRLRKRVTHNGVVTVQMPVSGDGRHCDYFTALGFCLLHPPDAPDLPEAGNKDDWPAPPEPEDAWERAARDVWT